MGLQGGAQTRSLVGPREPQLPLASGSSSSSSSGPPARPGPAGLPPSRRKPRPGAGTEAGPARRPAEAAAGSCRDRPAGARGWGWARRPSPARHWARGRARSGKSEWRRAGGRPALYRKAPRKVLTAAAPTPYRTGLSPRRALWRFFGVFFFLLVSIRSQAVFKRIQSVFVKPIFGFASGGLDAQAVCSALAPRGPARSLAPRAAVSRVQADPAASAALPPPPQTQHSDPEWGSCFCHPVTPGGISGGFRGSKGTGWANCPRSLMLLRFVRPWPGPLRPRRQPGPGFPPAS